MSKRHCVLSLSGGMDSSTLLLRALKEYDTVTAVSFNYGQKHYVELQRAQELVKYINNVRGLKKGHYYITHQTIKLCGMGGLLHSNLVEGGQEVPEGHYEQENMKATVVPNRNKIFSSLIQAVALSIVNRTGEPCDIALGIHAGDHAIYPDCRQEFRDADDHAFRIGNWDADKVQYFTPYLNGDKFDILKDGEVLCEELGLDFDEVYRRTNTSYKPIYIQSDFVKNEDGSSYGEWYADYKSASSVERIEAFIKLGRPDPALYADETGAVDWEIVKAHVEEVLSNYST